MNVRDIVHEYMSENPMWSDINIDEVCFYGQGGIFDSIDLVSFIIELEQRLSISLSTDKAFSHKTSPFSSLERLEEFVKEIKDGYSNNRN
jgi:acyl carrier protein